MTDLTVSSAAELAARKASPEAHARVAKRYRAEARFKAYGVAAIAFAAVFLVVLMTDIVSKAWPAFTATHLAISVTPEAADVDPDGSKSPASLARGDHGKSVRAAFQAQFPEVKDRAARRKLNGLLSSGAADELRDQIIADPKLIGQEIKTRAQFSDDADLYLKGAVTDVDEENGAGVATPSATSGQVVIETSNPAFQSDLEKIKSDLSDKARERRSTVTRLQSLLDGVLADRPAAETEVKAAQGTGDAGRISVATAALGKIDSDASSLKAQIDTLSAEATDFENRFKDSSGAETLDEKLPSRLVQINGGLVKVTSLAANRVEGVALTPLTSQDAAQAGQWKVLTLETPESERRVGDQEIAWLEKLKAKGAVSTDFNTGFFTSGDSREAEQAGILGALVGSLLTMFVTLAFCLPVGVGAAIYLEEFAPKNRWTDIIEININNLAAVPSIVYGLLGLAVFLNFFGMPRSSAVVGGFVLALLVLPTIIIASRAALKAVPPSIREAALGVGASHQQAVFHHVLPLAMPGVMTGTIIGMAHALGETAPLLLIGMVAFIVDVPSGFTSAATALPVQIYLWSDLPEVAFQAKTSAAILVLLFFLFVMNGLAIILRKRFERRW
ncbi:phosphate ABC transporter permease PstA [Chelatococcus sambhunathii]|uniref:Phosphate transport system permease protein PstA n=1 Tax=Chelatococcus sambhunathii TaxID=363953 RepID=A0ABU1DI47_9HYPH|nr:phosphate ABC transporter permease PstA [Chelatococcus sambhunathii]MDR4307669.1 phosphate ABC transporter permease PstA [Chelatococcus sambhunathii]